MICMKLYSILIKKIQKNMYLKKQERRKKLGEFGFRKLRFRLDVIYKIENTG